MSKPNRACSQVRALLSEFMDQRLEPKLARAIRLHLVQCEACTHEERALLAVSQAACCLPHEIPSTTLAEDVRAQDRGWLDPRTALLAVAAVLISTVIGILAYQQGFKGGQSEGRRRIASTDTAPTQGQGDVPSGPSSEDLAGSDSATDLAPLAPAPVDTELDSYADLEVPPGSSQPGEAQFASWIPDDHQAVRATQSLFADLDLMDSVPAELHRPMLQSQLEYFELDQWATRDAGDRPEAVKDVAELVRQMMDGLADTSDPRHLVQLRRAGDRENLWDDAYAVSRATGATGTRPDLAPFVSSFAGDLPQVTQDSLQDWLAYKERWVQSAEDPSDLVGLIESLPRMWLMTEMNPDLDADFQLPDLEQLLDEVVWTVTDDGARRGELNIRSQGINSLRSIMIVIEKR
jgi:hypothetical protein